MGGALNNLGMIKYACGNLLEARKLLWESIEVKIKVFKGVHPDMTFTFDQLGMISIDLGQYYEGESYLAQSLMIKSSTYSVGELLKTKALLGLMYIRQKEFTKAEEICLEILKARKDVLKNEENATIAEALMSLGNLYYEKFEYEMSQKLIMEVLQIGKNIKNFSLVNTALYSLGLIFLQKGDYIKSKEFLQESLEKNFELYGERFSSTAVILDGLGRFYFRKGEIRTALYYCIKANNIFKNLCPQITHEQMVNLHNMALIYNEREREDKAEKCYLEVYGFSGSFFEQNTKENLILFRRLSNYYEKKGDIQKAEQYEQVRINIMN